RIAAGYTERLRGIAETPAVAEGDVHGWQAYVVLTDRRDDALAAPRAAGIEAPIGTYARHRLGAYVDQGPFPGAGVAFERARALPAGPVAPLRRRERGVHRRGGAVLREDARDHAQRGR